MRLFMYPYCRDENHQSLIRAARIALLAAAMLAPHETPAQASASVALASDYSVRGVSLSDGRPAPQRMAGTPAHSPRHDWPLASMPT
jgi:hypothetical protein